MRQNNLTPIQQWVLDYYSDHFVEHWRMPSLREAMEALGYKSLNSVMCHLQALEKRGWIEIDGSTARGVRLVGYRITLERVAGGST